MSAASPTNLFTGFEDPLCQPNLRLRVGEHVIDVGALRVVTRPEYPRLTSKTVAVLLQLVRNCGNTVTREQLLDRVWTDRVTTQDVLTQAIKELRRAFADDARPSRYIETIPRVGYRLLAQVSVLNHHDAFGTPTLAAPAGNDPDLDVPAAPRADPPAETSASRPRLWWSLPVLAVVGAAIAAFVWRILPSTETQHAWQVSDMLALSSEPGSENRPRISPDGTRVAYSKVDPETHLERIMMRAIGNTQSQRWPSDVKANEDTPVWSPTGRSIVFERVDDNSCQLITASSLGGETSVVGKCQNPSTNYYDWSPDGQRLITAERSESSHGHLALLQWDLATGAKLPLDYPHAHDNEDLNAHYSPDGRWLAFRRGLAPYSDLWVMTADGRNARQLTQLRASIRGYTWSRDSSALIFSSNHEGHFGLYALDLKEATLQSLHVSPAEFPDAARNDDTVVYEIPRIQYKIAELDLGVQVSTLRTLAPSTGSETQPVFSPTDDRIVYISDRSGAQQLWLYDKSTGATTALTDFRDALLSNPSWSADGSKLLVTVRKLDQAQLFEIDLASRRQRTLSKSGDDVHSARYGPAPDSILLTLGVPGKDNQLLLVEHVASPQEQRHLLETGLWFSDFDPATHRLYYSESARMGVFVRELSAGGSQSAATLVTDKIMDGWRIVDGRIWYCTPSRLASKTTELRELNPQDGSERTLARIDTDLVNLDFSAAPSRQRIVAVTVGSEDTDIGAFRLTRASANKR